MSLPTSIYVNGSKRKASHIGTTFHTDSECTPNKKVASHSITLQDVFAIQRGERIFSGGNYYSLHPDTGDSDYDGPF